MRYIFTKKIIAHINTLLKNLRDYVHVYFSYYIVLT